MLHHLAHEDVAAGIDRWKGAWAGGSASGCHLRRLVRRRGKNGDGSVCPSEVTSRERELVDGSVVRLS